MKAPEFNVAVCQLTSGDNVESNARAIEKLLHALGPRPKLDLICFPENALYLRLNDGDAQVGFTAENDAIGMLSRWAVENQVPLHIGSVPFMENGRIYNTSLLLRPDGAVIPIYRKIHLFDVDVEGQKPLRESDFFAPGEKPSFFSLKGWRFGSSICYDVRFPELFLYYAQNAVDVVLIPAAFLVTTGRAHWDILVRARAIETQSYVLAAAQGGTHRGMRGEARETYGHSLVVDPWGQVIAECHDENGTSCILQATLRTDRIESVRLQIPIKDHRKLV